MRRTLCIALGTLVAVGIGFAAHADIVATPFNMEHPSSVAGLTIRLDVIDHGSFAELVISNDSTTAGVLTTFYIENTATSQLWGGVSLHDWSGGVSFSGGATPANPPGSISEFGGPWGGTLYAFGADNPKPSKGVGPGGWLSLKIDPGSSSVAAIRAAYTDPTAVRFAGHIQSLPDGSSAWIVTVPTPGTACLLALGGVLAIHRHRA